MQIAIQRAIDGLELRDDSFGGSEPSLESSMILNHVSLHKHQTEGVEWMLKRWKCGRSVIVADEMGLGKTLQTLAFISVLLEQKSVTGPFLVIAPLSVAPQWISQANTFIPDLRMFRYLGSADERELLRRELIEEHIMKLPREVLESGDPQPLPFDVMVTSYETCLADIDFVDQFKWRVIVFDEGHRLKNPEGVTHTTFLARLHANFKVILTGTPIQNNITEFWALLRFLNPEIFTDNTKPDVGESPPGMDLLVHALVLRRLAASSTLKLPPIDNLVIRTEMTKIQSDLYRWALFHYALSVRGESDSSVPPGILSNLMMTLRKISAHPYLFPGVEPEPFSEGPHIWLNSNKFIVLRSLLQKMKREQSRCLIFSTFTSLLDVCQDFLVLEKISYERLDGSVRSEERTAAIDRFASDKADVFLLSTRAGGVGLNLTAADWVIFLDTDWNPQMDLQAIARAFRQGQTKRVKVFRLITGGTIDELIFRRSLEKLKFASHVLGESVPQSSEMKSMVFQGASKLALESASHEMPTAQRLVEESSLDIESLIESTDESDLVVSDYKQFQGIDYAEKHAEIPPTDLEAMNRLMERAAALPRAVLVKQPPVVSVMKERAQKMTQEMRQKRKEEKWRQINYWSRTIPDRVQDEVVSHDGQPGEVRHVIGSFTEPLMGDDTTQKAVIVHIVDNSGVWPLNSRLFMSIGEKFPKIPKIYFQSKKGNDLHFGDVHVFSQSDLEPCADGRVCVALCVCHRDQDFDLLVQCLSKLSSHFMGESVSFHFSRIGDRSGKFYVTERIIRRYICASGADAYVYHYTQQAQVPVQPVKKKFTLLDYFKSVVPVTKPVRSAAALEEKPSVWLSPDIHQDLRTLYSRLLRDSCIVSADTEQRHDVYIVSALDGRKCTQELMCQLDRKFGVASSIEVPNTFEKKEENPTIMTTEMLEYMLGRKIDIV